LHPAAMWDHSRTQMVLRHAHPTQQHLHQAMEKLEQFKDGQRIIHAEQTSPVSSQLVRSCPIQRNDSHPLQFPLHPTSRSSLGADILLKFWRRGSGSNRRIKRFCRPTGWFSGLLWIVVTSCRISELRKRYPSAYKPFHAGTPTRVPTPSGIGSG
jgi:hypothetical protein